MADTADMAVSRPVVLALLGLVLSAATLVAARGAGETAADPGPSEAAAPVAVTPAPADKPATKDASPGRKPVTADERPRDKPAAARKDGPSRRKDSASRRKDSASRRKGGARAKLPAGVPDPVGRALRARRVVVLFFAQGGADDDATAEAVNGVRGLKRVSVFRAGIDRLARYRAVIGGLGVAQAPAVVIVGAKRRAQLVEGFVDPGTLKQLVLDAR